MKKKEEYNQPDLEGLDIDALEKTPPKHNNGGIKPPKYYTLEHTANILNITKNKLYLLIKSGKLKAHQNGAMWRVEHADLQAFTNKTSQYLQAKPKVEEN